MSLGLGFTGVLPSLHNFTRSLNTNKILLIVFCLAQIVIFTEDVGRNLLVGEKIIYNNPLFFGLTVYALNYTTLENHNSAFFVTILWAIIRYVPLIIVHLSKKNEDQNNNNI